MPGTYTGESHTRTGGRILGGAPVCLQGPELLLCLREGTALWGVPVNTSPLAGTVGCTLLLRPHVRCHNVLSDYGCVGPRRTTAALGGRERVRTEASPRPINQTAAVGGSTKPPIKMDLLQALSKLILTNHWVGCAFKRMESKKTPATQCFITTMHHGLHT